MISSIMYCQYCGKPADVIGVMISRIEQRVDSHSFFTSSGINDTVQGRIRVLAETELVGFCDEHDHLEFGSIHYLKCRITPENKKQIEKAIQQETVEHTRSVRVE